ncbi:MAG: class I SAM-dependent methyltransferase [Candidatus Dormibacteria bacterium]
MTDGGLADDRGSPGPQAGVDPRFVLPPSLDGELVALAEATNYRDWLFSKTAPHLGERVVEVGAGFGTMTDCVVDKARVVALELIPEYVATLHRRYDALANIEIHHGDATEDAVWDAIRAGGELDSAMSFNVFEHILDDVAVMKQVLASLRPGGEMVVFTPAFPGLFGEMDRGVGHVRRYTRGELLGKARTAGFEIVDCQFMNLPGFFLWYLNGKVLKSSGATGGAASVRLFDRWAVPLVRAAEQLVRPPFGQSLLLVARRPAPS